MNEKNEYTCIKCEKKYYSNKWNEKKKKHQAHCGSCAIKECWKDQKYRNTHIETLKDGHNSKEAKINHGNASKKNFENEEYKKNALIRINTTEARHKANQKIINLWKDPVKAKEFFLKMFKTRNRKINSKNGFLNVKSSYEERAIKLFDALSIDWEYEPKSFYLKAINKCYIPDFYLKNENIWVEIKGYWYKDAKEKWEVFKLEYPELNTALVNKTGLILLENGEKIENFINKEIE